MSSIQRDYFSDGTGNRTHHFLVVIGRLGLNTTATQISNLHWQVPFSFFIFQDLCSQLVIQAYCTYVYIS